MKRHGVRRFYVVREGVFGEPRSGAVDGKKLVSAKAKINKKCQYRKKLKIKRKKVGSAKRLKLKLAFPGNGVLPASSATYSVPVK